MFSQDGRRSPSLDTNSQGAEYVNTLPETSTLPRSQSQDSDSCRPPAACRSNERPRSEELQRSDESLSEERYSVPPRVEVVWFRPKEVLLQPDASSGSCTLMPRPERKSSGSAGSLERSASGGEESRCYINTIYMTIPEPSTAIRNNHLPPDPNRGALPPPPPGVLPTSEITIG